MFAGKVIERNIIKEENVPEPTKKIRVKYTFQVVDKICISLEFHKEQKNINNISIIFIQFDLVYFTFLYRIYIYIYT